MIAIKNTARIPYFNMFLCDSSILNPLEMDWPFPLSSYSYSKISNKTRVNSEFYDIQVATKSVLYSPFTYSSLWGTKPPLPCSSRDNAVISPNLWYGRVPWNIPSPLKLPFPPISTAKVLIVCYCHDKRLRFSRSFVRRLFSAISVVVVFFRPFQSKLPSFCTSQKYWPVNRNFKNSNFRNI